MPIPAVRVRKNKSKEFLASLDSSKGAVKPVFISNTGDTVDTAVRDRVGHEPLPHVHLKRKEMNPVAPKDASNENMEDSTPPHAAEDAEMHDQERE